MDKDYLIRIIVTTDTHGHWLNRPTDPNYSLLNLGSAVKYLKNKPAHLTLTIDLGDFIQGSPFATYLSQERGQGQVIARAMNQIGYNYQLIGNHEFNFGPAYRDQILKGIDAQILLSNIVVKGNQSPFIGKPYDIINFEELQIGIIGTTTSYIPHWELPEHYLGLEFLDAFEATKYYVDLIRPQVDLLIVCYHGGFERDLNTGQATEQLTGENQAYQMIESIEGIDLLLTGHQHRLLNQKALNTWVIQAGAVGDYLGEVEIRMTGKEIQSIQGHLHPTVDYPMDEELRKVMEPEISEANSWLNQVVGQAPLQSVHNHSLAARAFGHPYLELLNQIQLRETGADFSAVTLVNPVYADFTGDISNELLLKVYPFYNLIAKVELTGQDLYEIMEYNLEYYTLNEGGQLTVTPKYYDPKPRHYNLDIYSGLETTIDMRQPPGHRVLSLIDEAKGQKIEADKKYTLAVSQYRSVGGGDYHWFNQDKVLSMSEKDLASLLVEAIQTYSDQDWHYINHHYQHNIWQPPVEIADVPNQ